VADEVGEGNGFGLAEGLDFEKRQPTKALKFN